jgi:hypothetical protein
MYALMILHITFLPSVVFFIYELMMAVEDETIVIF